MEVIKFTFSRTAPTVDGTSVNYIFDISFRTFNWEISKRFSEFEFLLEQVRISSVLYWTKNTCLVGRSEICTVARFAAENNRPFET